jgi:hypothetical protein
MARYKQDMVGSGQEAVVSDYTANLKTEIFFLNKPSHRG